MQRGGEVFVTGTGPDGRFLVRQAVQPAVYPHQDFATIHHTQMPRDGAMAVHAGPPPPLFSAGTHSRVGSAFMVPQGSSHEYVLSRGTYWVESPGYQAAAQRSSLSMPPTAATAPFNPAQLEQFTWPSHQSGSGSPVFTSSQLYQSGSAPLLVQGTYRSAASSPSYAYPARAGTPSSIARTITPPLREEDDMVTTIIQDPITGAITLGEQVPRSVLERAAAGRHGGSPPRLEPQQSIPMHHPEPVRIVQAESGNSAVLQLQQECTRRGQLAVLPLQRDRTPQDIVVRKAPLATSSTESPIPDPYVTPRQAQRVSSGQRSGERSGEEPLFWVPVFASDMAGENTEGTSIITRRKSPATPPSRITRVETLESWASGSEDKSAQPEQRAHFRSWSYHEGGNGLKASLETAGKRRSNPPELSRKTSLPNAPEPLAQHVRRFQHLNIPIYDEADVDAALREQQRKRRAGSQQCSPPKGAPLEPSPKYPLPSPAFFIPASSPAPNLAASDIRREYGGYVGHNGELGRSSGLAGGAASSGLFDYREVTRFQSGDICYVESPASINEPMLGSQQAYGKPNDPEATPTPTLRKGGMDSFPGLSPDQTPTASISQSSSQRSIVSSATTLVRHSPIEPSAHLDLDSMSRSFSPLLFSPARTPLSPDPAAQINALRSRKASPYDDLWLRTLTPSMDTSSLPQQEVASSLEPAQRSDQHGPKSSTFSDNQFLASFESSDEGRTAGSKKRRR